MSSRFSGENPKKIYRRILKEFPDMLEIKPGGKHDKLINKHTKNSFPLPRKDLQQRTFKTICEDVIDITYQQGLEIAFPDPKRTKAKERRHTKNRSFGIGE